MRTLITGGGRGLGLALVRGALADGRHVGTTVRDPGAAEDLTALAAAHPGRLAVAALDVADADAIAAVVPALAAQMGGLDLVVNSAGVNAMSLPGARGTLALATLEAEPMLAMMRVNTVAPLLVAKAALPALRASQRPRIVNVSSWLGSIAGTTGSGNYAYAASKAALGMASRLMANELRDDGVVVVAMNPGWVRTGMGGPRAELSAEDSAAGILRVAAGLTPADTGRFLQWDGSEHPW